MLTRIECNGFRSLADFQLDIRPGVNLLLGPNGAGKTNIIDLLDFVGKSVDMPLSEAVSALGGAGAIFRKTGEVEYQNTVHIKLFGHTKITSRSYFRYELSLEIKLSEDRDSVIYAHQSLAVDKCTKSQIFDRKLSGDLRINAKLGRDGKVKIDHDASKKIEINFPRQEISKYLSELIDPEDSILQFAPRIAHRIWEIRWDIAGGLSLNVIPSKAKAPEDSTTAAKIQPDGSGLYATLRAAVKASKPAIRRRSHLRPYALRRAESNIPPDAYEKILAAAKFANSSIADIKINNDAFDNKLKGSVTLNTNGSQTELPIAAMSDGTIKWLVLVSAIYTRSKMLSIEEPENYLHPLIQMEIINIFREAYASDSFVLVSTHSETLLNAAKPEEVVIVEFAEGRTQARRVANSKMIRSEIRRTGFGLGFYYVSGALEGTK